MRPQIDPFLAVGISVLAQKLRAEGRSIIPMSFGQPSTGAPRAALEVAHRVLDTEPGGYWESAPLRERIARHYDESYGVKVAPEQIILTCGASPALVLALSSTFAPGDRVATARPGYVAYRNNLKALNLVPVEISCGAESRFQITAAHIDALDPAPAGLIISSPANPTGTIIEAEELAKIARVCRERGIRIISDEIYHGLSYVEPAHSMLEFEPDTLVVNSFSKYFSMVGWRLGWLLAPKADLARARAYVGNLFLTAPWLSQHVALAAMDARDELDANVAVYRANRALLLDTLPQLGLQAIAPPDGAFYIYADVTHLTGDSMAFCKALLNDTGVSIAPGIDFDPVEGPGYIRISFASSTAQVEEGIARMIPWFAAQTRL